MNISQASRHTVSVNLGSRSYPVHVGAGVLRHVGAFVAAELRPSSVAVVSPGGLAAQHADIVIGSLREAGVSPHVVRIAAGERLKNLRSVERICQAFAKARLDRRGLVVAVGGGVIGDLAGFAAAVYMRGVGVVQVPTTLLAQVDASVGGKTGVNLPGGKNLIGAFHQPAAVFADPLALATLPMREIRCGLAEVLKHGFICDPAYLDAVQRDMTRLLKRNAEALTRAVVGSVRIKAEVVMADETEQGLRAVLNFGHTVGHALETLSAYRSLRHGEAVALGMIAACRIGEEIGVTPSNVTDTVCKIVKSAGLPHTMPAEFSADAIVEAMRADKKSQGGHLRFVLLRAIGRAEPGFTVDDSVLRRALERVPAR